MKVLHTADWHVGKTLRRRQRLDEVAQVLDEVVDIAGEEAVDLTLVCGDLFDQFAPSAEAERIVYDVLLGLRETGSQVIVLTGNHDNPRRFEAVEQLLSAAGVTVVPSVRRPDRGGVVEVVSRDGSERAQVAVLPWVGERMMYGVEEMMGMEEAPHSAYAENLPRLLNALCAGFERGKIHLLAGHLFVSGTRPGGGERELTLGQLFAVSAQTLPAVAQYIALGHVHRPQEVTGSLVPGRYAGSLLQLDFGEREQEKSVVIVEVAPGVPAAVRTRALASGRSLLDVRGTMAELHEVVVDGEDYLRVTLVCGGPAPGLADEVREILPNALEVRLEYERAPGEAEPGEARRLSPRQLFDRYYNVRHGASAAPDLMTTFDELLEEVSGAPADA